MHYSPDGRSLVFTLGLGSDPPIRVVVRDRDGSQRVVMEGARSPCWLENGVVQAVGPDSIANVLVRASAPLWQGAPVALPGGNQHTAAAGKWAVARTDPRRILTSWGQTIANGAEPALSPDGSFFAYVLVPAFDGPNVLMVQDLGTRLAREVWRGAPIDVRYGWGSTALTWGEQGTGRIYGISGVGNPREGVAELTYRDFRCGWPRALWDGSQLWITMAADLGNSSRVILAEWDSAARGEHRGFIVADSTGSGFDMAVAA